MNNPAQSPLSKTRDNSQQPPQQDFFLPPFQGTGSGPLSPPSTYFPPFFPGVRSSSTWDAPPHSSMTPSDDNFNLDLLPHSLHGGVSAMSSRRPSYAAEFSSRPRLLDLPNPSPSSQASTNYQQLLPQHSIQSSGPFQQPYTGPGSAEFSSPQGSNSNGPMSGFDSEQWTRSGDPRNIWFSTTATTPATLPTTSNAHRPASEISLSNGSSNANSGFSPNANPANAPSSPLSGSLLLSPIMSGNVMQNTGASPTGMPTSLSHKGSLNSLNDYVPENPIGSQRHFRSMSFSHNSDRRNSPPKQMLSSFYEDSVDEATDTLGNTHLDEGRTYLPLRSQRSYGMLMNPQPAQSLWFNDNTLPTSASASASAAAAAAAAAINRRHSFVTVDSYRTQQIFQPQNPIQRQQNAIGSPVLTNTSVVPNYSPPTPVTRTSNKEDTDHSKLYPEVAPYFDVDIFGRKNSIVNADLISPAAAAALISVPSSRLYFVQFKACRVDVFFITESSNLMVQVGDLVIVDADRGRDLGKVIQINVTFEQAGMLKWRQHHEQQAALQTPADVPGSSYSGNGANQPTPNTAGSNNASAPNVMTPKQILRFAQPNEIQQIMNKRNDEDTAIKTCRTKVQEKNLQMQVLDAEYQWDRRKLTFFYSATHRIDFRDLVRDLFRIYKTRIWMCAMQPSSPLQAQPHPSRTAMQMPPSSAQQAQIMMYQFLSGPPNSSGPPSMGQQQNT